MSFSGSGAVGLLAFVLVVGGLAAGGEAARNSNERRDAVQQGLLAESTATQQTTAEVDFTGARALGAISSTAGKNPQLYRLWTALETRNWMLLNGQAGASTCPAALNYYVRQLPRMELSPAALDIALSALDGKTAVVGMYVPRFTHEPDLKGCLGYRYDVENQVLKVGKRTVTFLAPEQPGMALSGR